MSQTGSGKTYTMLGEIDDLEVKPSPHRGMTPRIFEFLFARIQAVHSCILLLLFPVWLFLFELVLFYCIFCANETGFNRKINQYIENFKMVVLWFYYPPLFSLHYLLAHFLLQEEESRRDERLKYNCKCSFLEIYNEQITDLLDPSSTNLLVSAFFLKVN